MKKLETFGQVNDNGELIISYRNRFMESVKAFSGRRIKLTVEPLYKKRSTLTENGTGQNGYYFGVIVQSYILGAWETQQRVISSDQAHDELKANCSYVERYNEETGAVRREIMSTASHTTVQAEEYYERCRAFIYEWFGIDVPLPNAGQLEAKM